MKPAVGCVLLACACAIAPVLSQQQDTCQCSDSCTSQPAQSYACGCPVGWTGMTVGGESACYKALCAAVKWEVANAECVAHNSTLATAGSVEEARFIRELVANVNVVWTGLYVDSARWVTAEYPNREVDQSQTFNAWEYSTPPAALSQCGVFGSNACGTSWTSTSCANTHPFVCKAAGNWPADWGSGDGAAVCARDSAGSDGPSCQQAFSIAAPGAGLPLCAPSQEAAFRIESVTPSGACGLTRGGMCFTDRAGQYGSREQCSVRVLRGVTLDTVFFDTETYHDSLRVNNRRYSGFSGPDGVSVSMGSTITWSTDGSVQREGFEVCARGAPSGSGPQIFVVSSSSPAGACTVTSNGRCIFDGGDNYYNNERCSFRVLRSTELTVEFFSTESFHDYLRIDGVSYSGTRGPNGITVRPTSTISWRSDSSVVGAGYRVCGAESPVAASAAPSSAPTSADAIFQIVDANSACAVTSGGQCFTDGPGNYSASERCSISVIGSATLQVVSFNVKSTDTLVIGSQRYSGTSGPNGVRVLASQTIQWQSSSSGTGEGFMVCASTATPSSAPTVRTPNLFRVESSFPVGTCHVTSDGMCITDGDGSYGNRERCTFRVLQPNTLRVEMFATESCCDTLTVGARPYRGSSGPEGVSVATNNLISWSTDHSVVSGGFDICGSTLAAPTPGPSCGAGWSHVAGRCFKSLCTLRTWSDAQGDCASHGGSLVEPRSAFGNEAARHMLQGTGRGWLGFSESGPGNWTSRDAVPATFSNWAAGVTPSRGSECAIMGASDVCTSTWRGTSCFDRAAYTCEAAMGVGAWTDEEGPDGTAVCSGELCRAKSLSLACETGRCGECLSTDSSGQSGTNTTAVVLTLFVLILGGVAAVVAYRAQNRRRRIRYVDNDAPVLEPRGGPGYNPAYPDYPFDNRNGHDVDPEPAVPQPIYPQPVHPHPLPPVIPAPVEPDILPPPPASPMGNPNVPPGYEEATAPPAYRSREWGHSEI